MACDAHVILVDAAPDAEAYARARLEELERRWSRFRPDSDISRLNAMPDALVLVSPDTVALLTAMKAAARATNGRYDPTLLAAITAAGYHTSADGSGRSSSSQTGPARARTIHDVAVDARKAVTMLPAGIGLDPGGIGKGLAADIVVTELLDRGTGGALVGVGGDLAAAGVSPTPDGWHVAIEDPFDSSRSLATVAVAAGGIATSSTVTRTWTQRGRRRHHIIDPATRSCATTDLAAVTVVARAGWEAEAHATAALLAGGEQVLDQLDRQGLAGMALGLDGTLYVSAGLEGAGGGEGSAT